MQACVAVDAMQSKRWLRSVITATTASIPPSAFSAAGSVSPVFFTNSFALLNQKGQTNHQLACSVKSSLQVLTTSHALPKSSLTPLPPQASFARLDPNQLVKNNARSLSGRCRQARSRQRGHLEIPLI